MTTVNGYTKEKILGEGAFGTVYLVKRNKKKKELVLKELKTEINEKSEDMFKSETKVMSRLNHINVVSYVDSFTDNGCFYIVMVYCNGGNLAALIKRQTAPMSDEAINLFRQLCLAVEYIHGQGVIHRDIKPENILLTSTGVLKLGDFGLSKIMECDQKYTYSHAGTPCYMAPEILAGTHHGNKCDIWSMGCVLYEMVTLKPAFLGDRTNIMSGRCDRVPDSVQPDLKSLIIELIKVNTRERPSATDILSKNVMRNIQQGGPQQQTGTVGFGVVTGVLGGLLAVSAGVGALAMGVLFANSRRKQ